MWNEPAIDSSGDINTFCRSLERLMEERFGDRVTIKKGFEVRRLLLDADRKRVAGVRCARAGAEAEEDGLDIEADKFILGSAEGGRHSQLTQPGRRSGLCCHESTVKAEKGGAKRGRTD